MFEGVARDVRPMNTRRLTRNGARKSVGKLGRRKIPGIEVGITPCGAFSGERATLYLVERRKVRRVVFVKLQLGKRRWNIFDVSIFREKRRKI